MSNPPNQPKVSHDFCFRISRQTCVIPPTHPARVGALQALLRIGRKMEGAWPAAGHCGAEPRAGVQGRVVQRLEQVVLRRVARQKRCGVLAAIGALHVPRVCVHRDCGLQVLPDPTARDALARLDDCALPRALAEKPCVLPTGAGAFWHSAQCQPQPGQPGPAHSGRHQPVHQLHHLAQHGATQRGGYAGELCGHFVGAVGWVFVFGAGH